MKNKEKMDLEKRIMNISLIGSILFVILEVVMAFVTRSHAILMDAIFDVMDLILLGPFLLLVPLLYKPVTEKRPYGFSQVESLFIVIKYSVLFIVTLQLIWDNIKIIFSGGREVDGGVIALFEFSNGIGCFLFFIVLYHYSKKYASLTVQAEVYNWKLDVLSSMGVSIAFFIEMLLRDSPWSTISLYIDPIVAIAMACFLIIEPVKMIITNLKNLVLFAPNQEIMDEIRRVAEKHMDKVYYDIEFLDVIQTGRKTWVEIYLTSHNDIINARILHQLRNEIRSELRKTFDQVYVELIPNLPDE